MTDQHDRFHLERALILAAMSRDPNTQVGSVIVGKYGDALSSGFNEFPKGIAYTDARLLDRDLKNKLMVHAERNAICRAARKGVALDGATLYLAATDDSGMIWGGAPCTACLIEILQAGIRKVVSFQKKSVPSKWREDIAFAETILVESGISYKEIPTSQ